MASKYDAGVYQQNRLANQMFGTPGMDRSAGAAFGQLAEGAGRVLQEEQRTADVRNSNIISGIHAVGSFLATAVGKMKEVQQKEAAARQQQKNMLEDVDVALAENSFADAANGMSNQLQEDYLDRPDEAAQPYRDFLDQQASFVYERFKDSPRAMAKLVPNIEAAKTRHNDQLQNWSFSARSKNAQQSIKNARSVALEKISRIPPGDLRNSVDAFNNILDQQLGLLVQTAPVLGKRNAETEGLALRREAGPAFFNTLLNNKPREPQAALSYISNVREVVDKHDSLGVYLDADDKKTLLSHLDHVEGQAYTELQNKTLVDELTISNHLLEAGIELNRNRNNPAVQSEAQEYAARMARGVSVDAERIKADPTLPEKTKVAMLRAKNAQMQHYKTLDNIARSNLEHIDSERRQDAREARSEARAAAREQTKESKEQLAAQKQSIKEELFDKRNQLRQLVLEDPVAHRQEMFRLSGEIDVLARKAVHHGLTDLGNSASKEAMRTATVAAKHEPATPGLSIFGIQTGIGAKGAPKPGTPEFAAKQKQYVQEIQRVATEAAAHDADMKKVVEAGLTTRKQQERYLQLKEVAQQRYSGVILQRKLLEIKQRIASDRTLL